MKKFKIIMAVFIITSIAFTISANNTNAPANPGGIQIKSPFFTLKGRVG